MRRHTTLVPVELADDDVDGCGPDKFVPLINPGHFFLPGMAVKIGKGHCFIEFGRVKPFSNFNRITNDDIGAMSATPTTDIFLR